MRVHFPDVGIRCQTFKSSLIRASGTLRTDPDHSERCLPVTAFELNNFSDVRAVLRAQQSALLSSRYRLCGQTAVSRLGRPGIHGLVTRSVLVPLSARGKNPAPW